MGIIALLTDFGLSDWYVGVMKGVILSINPEARLVDINHDIQPQSVNEAAFVLWNAYKYFPEDTVFVNVVDPGVGSTRDILAVKAGAYYFVAPDNDLLSYVLSEFKDVEAVQVSEPAYFLSNVSNTFHGRDIFAPIGAQLSKKTPIKNLGNEIKSLNTEQLFVNAEMPGKYEGKVIYVDHFGNLITNIKVPEHFSGYLGINEQHIDRVVKSYTEVEKGQELLIRGSSGLLEISIREGNAARKISAGYDNPVWLTIN